MAEEQIALDDLMLVDGALFHGRKGEACDWPRPLAPLADTHGHLTSFRAHDPAMALVRAALAGVRLLVVPVDPVGDIPRKWESVPAFLSWLEGQIDLARVCLAEAREMGLEPPAFEGWDAGGKGGAIKRLTQALDPRGYAVQPVSAPNDLEKSHHYLWRFWTNMPKAGHFTIFDRSWYGRVMVERIEGFCSEEEWRRAYEEINHFEQELTERGAILLKFWLHISPEEQLRRFHERQNTPEKQWKITDEDWRNREKWPAYEQAVDEMLLRTHRAQAPWIVVEAENKKFARLKVLHSVINAVEEALK